MRKELELRVALQERVMLFEKQNNNLQSQIDTYNGQKLLSEVERTNQLHQINLQIGMLNQKDELIKDIDKQRKKEKNKKKFWKLMTGAFFLGFVYQTIK